MPAEKREKMLPTFNRPWDTWQRVYEYHLSKGDSAQLAEYRANEWQRRRTTGAVDLGDSSAALEVDSSPEVLSAGQGESKPAPNH